MSSSRSAKLAAVAALLTLGIGCVAPYPYSYPYGSYPGTYGAPGAVPGAVPGPSLGAPAGAQLGAPTPVDGSASKDVGGDAPMFDPTGPDPNAVPNYNDPSPGDLGPPPGGGEAFDQGVEPFGASDPMGTENISYDAQNNQAPKLLLQSAEAEPNAPTPVLNADAEFAAPVPFEGDNPELALPYAEDEPLNPFDHDDQYRTLRGIVNFDDKTQTWSIIYDNKPSRDDDYGGVFTLVDHENFAQWNDNDIVYLEGEISQTEVDAYGKPKYSMSFMTKLQPARR